MDGLRAGYNLQYEPYRGPVSKTPAMAQMAQMAQMSAGRGAHMPTAASLASAMGARARPSVTQPGIPVASAAFPSAFNK